MKTKTGYTLLELLITLALLSALLLIAIPSWRAMMAQNRTAIVVNQLREAIALARSEAIKRSATITFCGSANQETCSGQWSNGYIVRSPNKVLRVFDGVSSGSSLVWRGRLGSENQLHISPSGLTEMPNGSFMYCPADRNKLYARKITVSSTGRIRVSDEVYCPL
jgi:type IV fimbrial biogenesis protein FimT